MQIDNNGPGSANELLTFNNPPDQSGRIEVGGAKVINLVVNRANFNDNVAETQTVTFRSNGATANTQIVRNLDCNGCTAQNQFGGACPDTIQCVGCCEGTDRNAVCRGTSDFATAGVCASGAIGSACSSCTSPFVCNEVSTDSYACNCPLPDQRTTPVPSTSCAQTDGTLGCVQTVTPGCGGTARQECVPCGCNATTCPNGCCDGTDACISSLSNSACGSAGASCTDCTQSSQVCFDPPNDGTVAFACCSPTCDAVCIGESDGCGGTCATVTNAPSRCQARVVGGGFQTIAADDQDDGNFVESGTMVGGANGCNSDRSVCIRNGRFDSQ